MEDYGKKLRQIRRNKEMSQKNLAKKIGKSVRTIIRWENKKSQITLSSLNSISKALEIPIQYFFQ